MKAVLEETKEITELILEAAAKARAETSHEPEPEVTGKVEWPVTCSLGLGLEGAIACESKIGYVNGSKGWLIYRGYDIFDLCAYSTFEEVSYLLLHGELPTAAQLQEFLGKLACYRNIPRTMRQLMGSQLEEMKSMAALRLGTLIMRRQKTGLDLDVGAPEEADEGGGWEACYRLIAGLATIAAGVARLREGRLPLEPDPELGHAANLLYMMTGRKPTPVEERIMDVALILHADHGMNASTFASMVVASTLTDIYFAVGSGIAALSGPLHGGANERVLDMLREIGPPENVKDWYAKARAGNRKVMGFGHRVYKAYDPRARVLSGLDAYLLAHVENPEMQQMFKTARALEEEVITTLGKEKGVFPNVDFYSGIVYACMGIPVEMFTPLFAVSRVSGWTARVMEYMEHNRIFRPRAVYTGELEKPYVPIEKR